MAATIIDGKKISQEILAELKLKIKKLKEKPGLAIVLVGDNAASKIYVSSKEKACKEAGLYCEMHKLADSATEAELLGIVEKLNQKNSIHGILVQLPLPKHINEKLILDSILPHKDVDGFTPINIGNLACENTILAPATPRAVMRLLESTGIQIEGSNAVVVGRSRIVGKPVALMLLEKNATVTICHSKTKNLEEHTKKADILVAAVGKAEFITKSMVKKGAVVIDVGINRTAGGIKGDVDFENVREIASFITPVPKGVGPMTIAMLIDNVIKAMEINRTVNNQKFN